MSFHERLEPSSAFEDALIERLTASGWLAFKFGQAQLPLEARKRLTKFEDGSRRPSLLRWMPDIITFRDFKGRSFVALIDAKVCGDRPNYAMEMSAIETCEIYTDYLFTPTFFVFDDLRVITPREARQRGTPGPQYGNGSGTPYLLVAKRYGRQFDEVFPAIKADAA